MFKSLLIIAVGAFAVAANIITFDDLLNNSGTSSIAIPNGYQGFNWSDIYVVDKTYLPGSGYDHGAVSGNNVAWTWGGSLSTASNNPFDFNGAYLTSAWSKYDNITITGSLNGVQKYSNTITVNNQNPTFFGVSYQGIDRLTFSSYSSQLAIDNISYTPVNTPEPNSISMILMGLFSLTGISFLRKKNK